MKLLQEMRIGKKAYVPMLWLYEVISVMAEAQRGGSLTGQEATEFFDDLSTLDIEVDSGTQRENIFGEAHRLAIKYRLTGYDAAYLELAMRTGLPLASLDKDLNKVALVAGVELVQV